MNPLRAVHEPPYGIDELYSTEATERAPRDPMAGEAVYLKATTWPIEAGQSVWITWTKNGVSQTPIGAAWQYNSGNNTYWQISMGSFARGDQISYTIRADVNGANQISTGPFSFKVISWSNVTNVSSYTLTYNIPHTALVLEQWSDEATLQSNPSSSEARTPWNVQTRTGNGTATNTNHTGYTGTGFADSFDTLGDGLIFSTGADAAGTYQLRFRYANATGSAATRHIYMDNIPAGVLTLPSLANWDTWGTATLTTTLGVGAHSIRIAYDTNNAQAINLISICSRKIGQVERPAPPYIIAGRDIVDQKHDMIADEHGRSCALWRNSVDDSLNNSTLDIVDLHRPGV